VEPTSGNTGIALAALAALQGIKLTVTIPDGVPEENKVLIRMLGAPKMGMSTKNPLRCAKKDTRGKTHFNQLPPQD